MVINKRNLVFLHKFDDQILLSIWQANHVWAFLILKPFSGLFIHSPRYLKLSTEFILLPSFDYIFWIEQHHFRPLKVQYFSTYFVMDPFLQILLPLSSAKSLSVKSTGSYFCFFYDQVWILFLFLYLQLPFSMHILV